MPVLRDDKLIFFSRSCKRYDAEQLKFMASEEHRQILDRFKGILDFTQLMTGWEMDVFDLIPLYNTLYIQSFYGLPLPSWTREVFPDAMTEFVGLGFALGTWTPTLKRLRSEFLLNTLMQNMKGKLNGSLLENISVYSGHETTLAALLNAMGVFNFLPPPFAAAVLMELRQTPGREPVITIFFKNSSDVRMDPVPLTLPGCTFACPVSALENLWALLMVSDWDEACKV